MAAAGLVWSRVLDRPGIYLTMPTQISQVLFKNLPVGVQSPKHKDFSTISRCSPEYGFQTPGAGSVSPKVPSPTGDPSSWPSFSSLATPLQGSSFRKSPVLSLVLCALMKPSQSQGALGGTAIQKLEGLKQIFLPCVLRVKGICQLLDQTPAVPGCTKQSQFWLPLSFRLVWRMLPSRTLSRLSLYFLLQTPANDFSSIYVYM